MAFTFRIVFSGLCSFVPNRPFDPDPANPGAYKPPTRVDVVVPNVLRSMVNGKAIIEPHYPTLELNGNDIQSIDNSISRLTVKKLEANRASEICPLLSEDLSIWPEGVEPKKDELTVSNGVPVDKEKPAPEEKNFIWWLPKLGKIMNKPMPTNPEYIDPMVVDHPVVAATIDLRKGHLTAAKLSPRKFQYRPIDKPVPSVVLTQKIAVKIALEMPINKEVHIVFRRFGSSALRSLILAPKKPSKKTIEVEINNMEANHLMGVKPSPSFSAFDPDFAVFFHLVTTPGPQDEWGMPHIKGGVPAGGYGKPCSPAG